MQDYTPELQETLLNLFTAGLPNPAASRLEVQPGSAVVIVIVGYEEQPTAEEARAELDRLEGEPQQVEAILREAGVETTVTDEPILLLRTGDGVVIISPGEDEPDGPILYPIWIVLGVAVLCVLIVVCICCCRRRRRRNAAPPAGAGEAYIASTSNPKRGGPRANDPVPQDTQATPRLAIQRTEQQSVPPNSNLDRI